MKISDRAKEKFVSSPNGPTMDLALRCLSEACDEWQASVEERLEKLLTRESRVAGNVHEFVADQLQKRKLKLTLSSEPPFVISDPGPSRYDPEVEPEAG